MTSKEHCVFCDVRVYNLSFVLVLNCTLHAGKYWSGQPFSTTLREGAVFSRGVVNPVSKVGSFLDYYTIKQVITFFPVATAGRRLVLCRTP